MEVDHVWIYIIFTFKEDFFSLDATGAFSQAIFCEINFKIISTYQL